MNALLQQYQNNQLVDKHVVGGSRFLIGRQRHCNLTLKGDDLISREHAAITHDRQGYWIEDLGSANGTILNGKKITGRVQLRAGDRIEVGTSEFIFSHDEASSEGGDETVVHSPPPKDQSPAQRLKKRTDSSRFQAKLRVVEGLLKGESFENWEGTLRIGRNPNCDVPLSSDEYVSLEHAEIRRDGDNYFVVDSDTDNGTFLNKRRIPPLTQEPLVNGDRIRLGKSGLLLFELVDLERERKIRKSLLLTLVIMLLLVGARALWPAPPAVQLYREAKASHEIGKIAAARQLVESALTKDPNLKAAQDLRQQIIKDEKLVEAMSNAIKLAGQGNVTGAIALLESSPGSSQAKQLSNQLRELKDAQTALTHSNWAQAAILLAKVSPHFAQTSIVASLLASANAEKLAEAAFTDAQTMLVTNNFTSARKSLNAIPSNSVYYTQARNLVSDIDAQQAIFETWDEAMKSYSSGDLEGALEKLREGVRKHPRNTKLTDLQGHIEETKNLNGKIPRVGLAESTDIDALLEVRKTCDKVVQHEVNITNAFHKAAQETKIVVNRRLGQIATNLASRVSALSSRSVGLEKLDPGDLKSACQLMLQAAKADSQFQKDADDWTVKLQRYCRQEFEAGYQILNLDRTNALNHFMNVTNYGLPRLGMSADGKDDYFQKAMKALRED